MKNIRVIAFYLPQYHPISQNNAVWGEGFTEWVNVAKARPLFKGHYQPHIPRDLGFYDLRMSEIREAQAKIAQSAGIEGFMYWQYYFEKEKVLLQMPFEEVLSLGSPDYPFCLGWANHSWQTATWTTVSSLSQGQTMIMEQKYDGEEQYEAHFRYNLPAFKDKRYITIDGKPLFIIWNPKDHSTEIEKLITCWQKLARENGLKGIHFVGRQYIGDTNEELLNMGFDAIYQERTEQAMNKSEHYTFLHRVVNRFQKILGINLILNKHDFGKCYKMLVNQDVVRKDVYPMLTAGFDRTPRAGRKAQIFYNFTPETWRLHIRDVFSYIKHKDKEHNIVMLKSWNEWGEGNHMEPDQKYGSALLQVLKEELR